MRLKFLISLLFTTFFYACAKDQASQGPQETLSQDQADSSSGQNGSNDQGSENNNQASANSGDEAAAAPPGDEPTDAEVETGANGGLDAPLDGTGASASAESGASDPGVPLDEALPPVTDTPAQGQAPEESAASPASQEPTPSASASRSSSGRMVRYVIRDNTAIVLEPQTGAKEVGNLSKGDSVLVEEQGEYAKIGEGKFVAKEALSEEIITRSTSSNPWK